MITATGVTLCSMAADRRPDGNNSSVASAASTPGVLFPAINELVRHHMFDGRMAQPANWNGD
jgi:hypothetical protein